MDLLKYKIVNATEGSSSISAQGLSLAQILKVARQGDQKDFVGPLSISVLTGNQWTYSTIFGTKRIYFSNEIPFVSGEKIYIMYKVTV